MLFPSSNVRPVAERVCPVRGQLSLPRAFIDRDLAKCVVWNSRFLKSLAADSIRKRTAAGRRVANQRGVRFGRPRKLSERQISLGLRLPERDQRQREALVFRISIGCLQTRLRVNLDFRNGRSHCQKAK